MSELATKPIKSFMDLTVWQKSHRLYLDTFSDLQTRATGEPGSRELSDQLLRSVGSISANIAEGFGSGSAKEYCRYLNIARKSCAEAQNWYIKAGCTGLVIDAEAKVLLCTEILKMLYSLREAVKRSSYRRKY